MKTMNRMPAKVWKLTFGRLCALAALAVLVLPSCEELDDDPEKFPSGEDSLSVPLQDVALILSELPIGDEQVREVYEAVSSSSWNGYDEEYTMKDLFREPGAGVGDDRLPAAALATKAAAMRANNVVTRSSWGYSVPLRDLIVNHLRNREAERGRAVARSGTGVAAGGGISLLNGADGSVMTADEYVAALQSSDIQIYWPYSEAWDGTGYPIITFDPDDGGETNVGYKIEVDKDGNRVVSEVVVDEVMATRHPVWVVNRNNDSGFTSLEMLRMTDPAWGEGGGEIIVRPRSGAAGAAGAGGGAGGEDGALEGLAGGGIDGAPVSLAGATKANSSGTKMLMLKEFTMMRNFDPWFAGASEFFIKIGSVEDFTASTEAELRLYSPAVTDFMKVVRRQEVGIPQLFNAVLVSDWTEQLQACALMITEDDGGTTTSWNCTAVVKVNSKSYGFEISLPIRTRDDIVWRGQLSRKYILANDGRTGHFGDVNLVFEIIEY